MLPVPAWNFENKRVVNSRGIFRQFIFESLEESSPMLGPRTTHEGKKPRNPLFPVLDPDLSTLREKFSKLVVELNLCNDVSN